MFSKKQSHYKTYVALFIFNFIVISVMAQGTFPPTSVKTVITKINAYNADNPFEKLHLQFDKPYYSIGDTIWFKGYLLNSTLKYSPLSTRLYVELLNDSDKIVKRMAIPMGYGITWGNLQLDSNLVHEGAYTVRAYTNWMRNFGDDCTFYRSFYISNPSKNSLIVNSDANVETVAGKDNVNVKLQIKNIDNIPLSQEAMQYKVLNGNKVIYRGNMQTSTDGTADAGFILPEQTSLKNIRLITNLKSAKKKTATIPLQITRPADVDIQFMPESGQLVAGLPISVGFKAIGEDGLGVDVQGSVFDKDNIEVARFSSKHKGLGHFDIVPQNGQVYTAHITLPNGQTKIVNLPTVKTSGTVLRIKNDTAADSLTLAIYATADLLNKQNIYYLIGQSRGEICYGASLNFASALTRTKIDKSLFPTGIAHFTLLNASQLPINERITFINHQDNLNIAVAKNLNSYAPRDSVVMHLTITDDTGKPALGSFSVAVTDDAQVKKGQQGSNILSDMLLKSELKGYIEDAAYYFNPGNKDAQQELEALMLTQGWIAYNWKDITAAKPVKPQFAPEYEYTVSGKVTNILNKPIANSTVTLLAKSKTSFVKDTVTNSDGAFMFNKFPPIDTAVFVLQARRARGRIVNAGISVDNVSPAPVEAAHNIFTKPWYVNTDSTLLNYVKTNTIYHQELDKAQYGPSGRMLRSVTIKGRASVKGSDNLNGAGNSDQVVGEAEIEKAGKATLLELIEQTVKNFHTQFARKSTDQQFYIKDKKVRFVIDGIDLDRFFTPSDMGTPIRNERYNYLRETLDYLTAEDILGIEVLYTPGYVNSYNTRNLNTDELLAIDPTGPMGSENAYLEITTRSGNGPFMKHASGIYVYKPLPLTRPSEFYSPKYLVKNASNKMTDLRSTIYWQPNVITNKKGEATIKFFAADKVSNYSVIIEGADLNGKLGYQTSSIKMDTTTQ